MAQNIVEAMRDLAARGKTIISTIHQPSSEVFALFDRVLLMAEGRVAYLGSIEGALKFFGG
ncbi:ATPase activity protein [Halocaridina rubra]|uniref:ATPase activity protein n=1 Tax=Halocaridina rubra TaxID=373956 RepID=A0AAN9A1D5_HALRR